jgi:hypothetical protein
VIRPVQPWRKMHASFFTDVEIARAERLSGLPVRFLRFFFAGLWVQADDAGRFEWDAMVLRAKVAPYDPDVGEAEVQRALEVLTEGRWIRPYEVRGLALGEIKNWARYQVSQPRPDAVRFPAPTDDEAEPRARDHVRESRARDQVRDPAGARTVREQTDQQQDHSSDRRRHASRARTDGGADDDDSAHIELPGWLTTLFGRAYERPPAGSERALLSALLSNEGEPRLRAALERMERQAKKGDKPRAITYLTSTVDDLHRGDTLPDGHAVRPVGGLPIPTEEMRAAWDAQSGAFAQTFAKAPPCPRCGGTGAVDGVECQAWGAAYADEPEDWRCRSGRRVAAEDYELEMLTETRGRWRCPPHDTEETHGVA